MSEETEYLSKVVVPLVTFALGFFVSRLTMTKAERAEHKHRMFKETKTLLKEQEALFNDLTGALKKYIDSEEPTFDNFYDISTAGERYLYGKKILADAILTNSVEPLVRDETFVPQIVDCANSLLPRIYSALQDIADKQGFAYEGELDRKKYQSIFTVAEKYGR